MKMLRFFRIPIIIGAIGFSLVSCGGGGGGGGNGGRHASAGNNSSGDGSSGGAGESVSTAPLPRSLAGYSFDLVTLWGHFTFEFQSGGVVRVIKDKYPSENEVVMGSYTYSLEETTPVYRAKIQIDSSVFRTTEGEMVPVAGSDEMGIISSWKLASPPLYGWTAYTQSTRYTIIKKGNDTTGASGSGSGGMDGGSSSGDSSSNSGTDDDGPDTPFQTEYAPYSLEGYYLDWGSDGGFDKPFVKIGFEGNKAIFVRPEMLNMSNIIGDYKYTREGANSGSLSITFPPSQSIYAALFGTSEAVKLSFSANEKVMLSGKIGTQSFSGRTIYLKRGSVGSSDNSVTDDNSDHDDSDNDNDEPTSVTAPRSLDGHYISFSNSINGISKIGFSGNKVSISPANIVGTFNYTRSENNEGVLSMSFSDSRYSGEDIRLTFSDPYTVVFHGKLGSSTFTLAGKFYEGKVEVDEPADDNSDDNSDDSDDTSHLAPTSLSNQKLSIISMSESVFDYTFDNAGGVIVKHRFDDKLNKTLSPAGTYTYTRTGPYRATLTTTHKYIVSADHEEKTYTTRTDTFVYNLFFSTLTKGVGTATETEVMNQQYGFKLTPQ